MVNDGSMDKTAQILKNIARDEKKIKIVSYRQNKGKGYAVAKGVSQSIGKLVLFADLDHSVPIETVENLFPFFENNHQVVIGSRRVKGAKLLKRQKFIREFLGRCFTLIVRVLIDANIKDATCGFKMFDGKIAKKLFKKQKVFRWAFDAELLYICKKNHIDVVQAPVTWRDVSGSKVSLKKDVLSSLLGLISIRIYGYKNSYYF